MFRLPTHLSESLVPPPAGQVPQSQPWRGALVLPASSPHPSARPREIWVTAAETENDNSRQENWPARFQLQIVRRPGILREVHAWLAQLQPGQLSRCMIMPDRLPGAAASRENQTNFEGLALRLIQEDMVALSPWSINEPSSPGGLLIYPTTTTHALLVGIVFLNVAFPEFLVGPGSHSPLADPFGGPSRMYPGQMLPRLQPFQHSPFEPAPPPISSAARYNHGQGASDPSRGGSGRRSG